MILTNLRRQRDRMRAIQRAVNEAAVTLGRPTIDILNEEETRRIVELIAAQTWPDGWDGTESHADVPLDKILRGGAVQPLLGLEEM